jgi:hypothetical protein
MTHHQATAAEKRTRLRNRRARRIVAVWNLPLSTIGLVVLCAWFAFGMLVQSSRWYATPAYGNLLIIFRATTWGWIYLGIAIVLAMSLVLRQQRWLGMVAHTFAFVLLVMWEAAFIIRWITDSSTTVVNVGSWALFLALTLRSAMVAITDLDAVCPAPAPVEAVDVGPSVR